MAFNISAPEEVLDEFCVPVAFDAREITVESLRMNSYDPSLWWAEAVTELEAVTYLGKFLRTFSFTRLTSKKTNKPYNVPKLIGHNIARFDLPRLEALFKRHGQWFPVVNNCVFDTLHLARWLQVAGVFTFSDLKLDTLATHFAIKAETKHDAQVAAKLLQPLVKARNSLGETPQFQE